METAYLDSPLGQLEIVASAKGITCIAFSDTPRPEPENSTPTFPHLISAKEQLARYFAGELTAFDCPLDLDGTDFQLKTWGLLGKIPFGQTKTYGELAREAGDPNASRAIGMANNRNPVPIIVPCHRVIGASQKLVGFGGGIWRKQWLLEHEGIILPLGN